MENQMRARFDEMLKAASICDREELDMPGIVLLYSLTDSLAWTVFKEETNNVGERFERFCDEFVITGSSLPCSAREIYAARCSTLHFLGWESNLTKHKGVRALFYGRRGTSLDIAQKTADAIAPGQFIGVHTEHLHDAIKVAVDRVVERSLKDLELAKRLKDANISQYRNLSSAEGEVLFGGFLESQR